MDQLANFVLYSSHLGHPTNDGQQSLLIDHGSHQPSQRWPNPVSEEQEKKRLNPYFTEFLMGWPEGWTSPIVQADSGPAEMASFRLKLQSLLLNYFDELTFTDLHKQTRERK